MLAGAMWKVMPRLRLDRETADRMLGGGVLPEDAPPGFEGVCRVIHAAGAGLDASADLTARGTPRADRRIAPSHLTRRRSMVARVPSSRRLPPLAVAFAILAGTTGAAYAAGLPDAASSTASAVLDELGVAAPAAHHATGDAQSNGHGATISQLARTTTATGADKGAEISAAASDGKSHAGEHGHKGRHNANGKGNGKAKGQSTSHGKGKEISTLARTTTATGVDKGAEISTAASGGKSHAGEHGGGSSSHGHASPPASPGKSGDHRRNHGGGGPS